MLILLPFAFGLVVFLTLLGAPRPDEGVAWHRSLVLTAISSGVLVAVSSELLSPFSWIRPAGLATAWAAGLAGAGAWGLRSGRLSRGWNRVRTGLDRFGNFEIGLAAFMALIAVVLLAVALVSPPNNVDSLLYHMSRVMHWAQNGSLRHYATGYNHQLIMPPWAELAILHLRVLWGNDRFANVVQWFAMIGSTLIAPGIARNLGASRRGQFLTAAFVVSLPSGILQSTSTQNDYVVAFWCLCAAYFLTLSLNRRLDLTEVPAFGAALGLGVMTKVTFLSYGLPLGAGFVLATLRKHSLGRAAAQAGLVLALVCLMNAGIWSRNLATYGGLYGDSSWMGTKLAPTRLLSALGEGQGGEGAATTSAAGAAERFALAGKEFVGWFVPRTAQAAALHLVSPSGALNLTLWRMLDRFPALFGSVTTQSLANAAWNHEDTAGSPVHVVLAVLSLLGLAAGIRRSAVSRSVAGYGAVVMAAGLTLVLVVQRASSGFGVRYHLPVLVLWAPIIGCSASAVRGRWLPNLASVGLLVLSIPYVLLNNTRPVIGLPPWPTRVDSVFTASELELLFAANAGQADPYAHTAELIEHSACTQVGLRIDSGDLEYAIWRLLQAPQSGIRIETVYTFPRLERYLDRSFHPCAVICTICSDRERLYGLPIRYSREGINLYAGPDFTWDPDG